MTAEETFRLAVENHQKNKFEVAEILYNDVLNINPNHVSAYNNLGIMFQDLNKIEKAKNCYEKAIKIDPTFAIGYNNLGTLFKLLGKNNKAKSCYEKAIENDPNNVDAHNNLGAIFQEAGNIQKAIDYYKKTIILKPDYTSALYNLGVLFFLDKQYKDASEQFKLINYKDSKSLLLNCLYYTADKYTFFKEFDAQTKQGKTNAIIGSLTYCSEIKYGVKKINTFCEDPLKYFLITNLNKKYDFKKLFIEPIKDILEEDIFSLRQQNLLTNGYQTQGNIFDKKNYFLDKIKEIIYLEIAKYQNYFKESNEGLITNWPISYSIVAWFVNMKSGGNLKPHMHNHGWLSGSIYINVPKKLKTNSGNLVVCMSDQEQETQANIKQKKIIDVETGSLCLFPSSLYHYTIPFESKEDRVVLAFDVLPDVEDSVEIERD